MFNTLGAIPGNIVIFLVISLAGNALNFALNLLGCYVHDPGVAAQQAHGEDGEEPNHQAVQALGAGDNLENHDLTDKPFRPLAMETKYVDITK